MRTKFKIKIPSDIIGIKNVLQEYGYVLFPVGGCVRDLLLDIEPKDWDLATDAHPDEVEKILNSHDYKTLATGKAFGVINVFTEDNEFEIATFRKDIGVGRRPDAVEFTTIEGDVMRRDLTCNALFYDIEREEIVDLVGGMGDIHYGIVRTVGLAKDRFNEDRLRILRAIRFTARFGGVLDKGIIDALKEDNSLEGISGERIHDEFVKGIKSAGNVKHFLGMINNFELFNWIFPDLVINLSFTDSKDPTIVIAKLLLHYNDINTLGKKLNELKFSTNDVKNILFLISLKNIDTESVPDFKRAQKRTTLTDEQIIQFANMIWVSFSFITRFLEFELSVDGNFVMEKFGIQAGPELGKKINLLEIENFLKL